MTDNEVIKALKCLCGDEIPCKDCAYKSDAFACRRMAAIDALDLITSQQAEIERLKIENQSLRSAAIARYMSKYSEDWKRTHNTNILRFIGDKDI